MKENILNRSVNDIRLRSFQKQLNKTDSLLFNRDNSIIHIKKTNNVSLFNNNNLGVGFSCNKFDNLDTYSDRGTSVSVDINAVKSSNKEIKKVCNNVYEDIFFSSEISNRMIGTRFGNIFHVTKADNNYVNGVYLSALDIDGMSMVTETSQSLVQQQLPLEMTSIYNSPDDSVFTTFNPSAVDSEKCVLFQRRKSIYDFLYNKDADHFFSNTKINNEMLCSYPYELIDYNLNKDSNRIHVDTSRMFKNGGNFYYGGNRDNTTSQLLASANLSEDSYDSMKIYNKSCLGYMSYVDGFDSWRKNEWGYKISHYAHGGELYIALHSEPPSQPPINFIQLSVSESERWGDTTTIYSHDQNIHKMPFYQNLDHRSRPSETLQHIKSLKFINNYMNIKTKYNNFGIISNKNIIKEYAFVNGYVLSVNKGFDNSYPDLHCQINEHKYSTSEDWSNDVYDEYGYKDHTESGTRYYNCKYYTYEYPYYWYVLNYMFGLYVTATSKLNNINNISKKLRNSLKKYNVINFVNKTYQNIPTNINDNYSFVTNGAGFLPNQVKDF